MASNEPIRVAIDATPLLGPVTGIGVSAKAMIEGLAKNPAVDLTGFIVSLRGATALGQALPAGVKPHRAPYSARLARSLWKHADWPSLSGFDIVHGTNFVTPPAPGSVELVTINDMTPWDLPEMATSDTRRYPKLVERAIGRGAHIHTISQFVGQQVVDRLAISPDRVHAIPIGFDPSPMGRPEAGHRAAGTDNYIVAVGTVEPRKDYPSLVEALKMLRSDRHPELRLVIVGMDGWGAEALAAAIEKFGMQNAIQRTGYLDAQSKADLISGARCLAYPSVYEGFGIPPLEAMAEGVPVVATRAGAIPEVLGNAAKLVNVGDPTDMAQGIDAILANSEKAAGFVELGRNQVNKHSWETTISGLIALYQALVGR